MCHVDHYWKYLNPIDRVVWNAHGWNLGLTGRKYRTLRHRPSGIEPLSLILTVSLIWIKLIFSFDFHYSKTLRLRIDESTQDDHANSSK